MRRKTEAEIRESVQSKYVNWVSCFGLADALRVHRGLGKKLKVEKKRRKESEGKKR